MNQAIGTTSANLGMTAQMPCPSLAQSEILFYPYHIIVTKNPTFADVSWWRLCYDFLAPKLLS